MFTAESSHCDQLVKNMEASNITCTNSSKEFHEIVFTIKMTTSSVSCFMNIIALLIMFLGGSFVGNNNRNLLFRLVIYLLIADLLLVIVQILELMPVTYKSGRVQVRDGVFWRKSCSVFGFFDQLTAWMRNFVVILIVIFLYVMIKKPEKFLEERSERSKTLEAIGVCICFFLPFTFNWIPIVDGYYGLSGHWCWIKLTSDEGCEQGSVTEGVVYMLVLYYVPLLLIISFTSLVFFYLVYMWLKKGNKHCEIVLLGLYPIIFDVFCLIMTINRVVSAVDQDPSAEVSLGLWILHSFADSGRTILPSSAIILSLLFPASRNLLCPRLPKCVPVIGERRPLLFQYNNLQKKIPA